MTIESRQTVLHIMDHLSGAAPDINLLGTGGTLRYPVASQSMVMGPDISRSQCAKIRHSCQPTVGTRQVQRRRPTRSILMAADAAPKPLSMFTTTRPGAQLASAAWS